MEPTAKVQSTDGETVASSSETVSTKKQTFAFHGTDGKSREAELSARCRYLDAQAGIQRSILRTPTVSAEVDHEGSVSASVAYDLVDIRRSKLQAKMADARCRQHLASTKLVQLLITSSQSLTQAGYIAKANSLRRARPHFRRIEQQIVRALDEGEVTLVQATTLKQTINRLRSDIASAEGQAVRREAIGGIQRKDTQDIDLKLVEAQRDIEQIQSEIRTASLYNVSLTGGYNSNTSSNSSSTALTNNNNNRSEDLYGNVKVSVRLAAFSKKRRRLEVAAEEARIDALYAEDSGLLWRSRDLARIQSKALKNLYDQKRQLEIALQEARRNSRLPDENLQTELLVPRFRAQIDILALRAEIAGINATIADSKRLQRKLRFQ